MKKIIIFLVIIICIFSISMAEMPKISTLSAVAIEPSSKRILYEKNAFSKRPMASTTKIMTIILAAEYGNPNDIVTISKRASKIGGSTVGLKEGDRILLSELLYGLMLNSGNDAGVAVAEHIGGSVEKFAKMMNEKAIEIGAYDSSFVTPHGLDNPEHYSTAYDMAIIAEYAMRNNEIAKIVGTIEKDMNFIDGTSKALRNTNPLLTIYSGANGVKTGYTGMAGRCLISSAERNGMKVIVVTLGSQSSQIRIKDSVTILNYCFNNFKMVDLRDLYREPITANILKGKKDKIVGKYKNSYCIPIKKNEEQYIKIKCDFVDNLYATVREDEKIGSIEFKINNEKLGEIDIIAKESILRLDFFSYYKKIVKQFCKIHKYVF